MESNLRTKLSPDSSKLIPDLLTHLNRDISHIIVNYVELFVDSVFIKMIDKIIGAFDIRFPYAESKSIDRDIITDASIYNPVKAFNYFFSCGCGDPYDHVSYDDSREFPFYSTWIRGLNMNELYEHILKENPNKNWLNNMDEINSKNDGKDDSKHGRDSKGRDSKHGRDSKVRDSNIKIKNRNNKDILKHIITMYPICEPKQFEIIEFNCTYNDNSNSIAVDTYSLETNILNSVSKLEIINYKLTESIQVKLKDKDYITVWDLYHTCALLVRKRNIFANRYYPDDSNDGNFICGFRIDGFTPIGWHVDGYKRTVLIIHVEIDNY